MVGDPSPVWPLATAPKAPTAFGSFGQPRPSMKDKKRTHLGVDLDSDYMAPVYAMESGTLTVSQGWDGPETRGLWLETPSGLAILYGAVAPGTFPKLPYEVSKGQKIANIGRYPKGSTMLHLETWIRPVGIPRPEWPWGAPRPANAMDPAEYLSRVAGYPGGQSQSGQSDADDGDVQGGGGTYGTGDAPWATVAIVGLGLYLIFGSKGKRTLVW